MFLRCRIPIVNKRDLCSYLYGINSEALFDLSYTFSKFLRSLSTPQQILEWTLRVSAVIARSESNVWLYIVMGAAFTFIRDTSPDPLAPEWLHVKKELCALCFTHLNPECRGWVQLYENFQALLPPELPAESASYEPEVV